MKSSNRRGDEEARRILVTGSGGYIGGRLVAHLANQPGTSVRAISHAASEFVPAGVETVPVNMLAKDGPALLVEASQGIDAVVHLAGPNEVIAAQDPEKALSDTVRLAYRVARAASVAGVERVIYVSTVHVYGNALVPGAVVTEGTLPAPRHPYAIARLASEHVVRAARSGAVIFRLTNAVGAPLIANVNRWSLVANDLCRQAVMTGSLRLRTSGTQWRDFVALADVCSVLAAAANVGSPHIPSGTYNLASGRPCTVRGLAEEIQAQFEAITGCLPPLFAPDPEPEPPGPFTVSTFRLDQTGWRANAPLSVAINEAIRFCLEHREELGYPVDGADFAGP